MEEDKKKKKNKKKKNKQNTARINDTSAADGSVGGDSVGRGKNQSTTTTQDDAGLPGDIQAAAQEPDNQEILMGKDLNMGKEVKHDGLLERLEELEKENAVHIQLVASLEEQISQLEKERDVYTNKESLLEVQIAQLWKDKESWSNKEALLEENIKHLMDLDATLGSEKVSLEKLVKQLEEERDAWILQENLTKEVISSLNGENSNIKSQVVELEEMRNSLLRENHLLKEMISDLQSQVLNLERTAVSTNSSAKIKIRHLMENGDVAPQSESAGALIEKSLGENFELVEKVNELPAGLHDENPQQESSFTNFAGEEGSLEVADGLVATAEMHKTEVIDAGSVTMNGSNLMVHKSRTAANNNALFPDSSSIDDSSVKIVQIPLDEIEREPSRPPNEEVEKDEVPLTDAPLIGAPFRLISFVARYVSGADLVKKNSGG